MLYEVITNMKVTGKRILLVEDEALIAMAVQKQLSVLEYCVDVVSSGEQAVEFISSNTNTDLILMDINLGPGIDGTEAAARIRITSYNVCYTKLLRTESKDLQGPRRLITSVLKRPIIVSANALS